MLGLGIYVGIEGFKGFVRDAVWIHVVEDQAAHFGIASDGVEVFCRLFHSRSELETATEGVDLLLLPGLLAGFLLADGLVVQGGVAVPFLLLDLEQGPGVGLLGLGVLQTSGDLLTLRGKVARPGLGGAVAEVVGDDFSGRDAGGAAVGGLLAEGVELELVGSQSTVQLRGLLLDARCSLLDVAAGGIQLSAELVRGKLGTAGEDGFGPLIPGIAAEGEVGEAGVVFCVELLEFIVLAQALLNLPVFIDQRAGGLVGGEDGEVVVGGFGVGLLQAGQGLLRGLGLGGGVVVHHVPPTGLVGAFGEGLVVRLEGEEGVVPGFGEAFLAQVLASGFGQRFEALRLVFGDLGAVDGLGGFDLVVDLRLAELLRGVLLALLHGLLGFEIDGGAIDGIDLVAAPGADGLGACLLRGGVGRFLGSLLLLLLGFRGLLLLEEGVGVEVAIGARPRGHALGAIARLEGGLLLLVGLLRLCGGGLLLLALTGGDKALGLALLLFGGEGHGGFQRFFVPGAWL